MDPHMGICGLANYRADTPPKLLQWVALGVKEVAMFIECGRTPNSVFRVGICGVLVLYRKPRILENGNRGRPEVVV